jgi:predicted lysophospholipase L1 biosynthesis ABC-type transport system permease subunit
MGPVVMGLVVVGHLWTALPVHGSSGHLLALPPAGGIAVLGVTLLAAAVRPLLSLRRRGNVRLSLRSGGFSHGLRQMARDLGLDFFSELMIRH